MGLLCTCSARMFAAVRRRRKHVSAISARWCERRVAACLFVLNALCAAFAAAQQSPTAATAPGIASAPLVDAATASPAPTAAYTQVPVAAVAAPAASFGTVDIAAPTDALTFARVGGGIILVKEYRDGIIKGVNLTCALGRVVADPIDVFLKEGYASLRKVVLSASDECVLASKVSDLGMPVDLRSHHIAAGTNFAAHAGEAQVEDGPFLFAKLVEPTVFNSPVSAGDGLLDYEVELAWVTLEPLRSGEVPRWMGVILCNDYTDRAALMRHLDPYDIASAKGFTTGKSFPGYLPVGNLFVIPNDYRAFATSRELRLWVNGQQRQKAPVSAAIWGFDQLLAKVWEWQTRRWMHQGGEVSLLEQPDVIPARTLLMVGTPSGTAFQGVPRDVQIDGVLAWLMGGWDRPVAEHVFDLYIDAARTERRFLQPGDQVVIQVEQLGEIDNRVESTK